MRVAQRRWGFSWQIVPRRFVELMTSSSTEAKARVFGAMMQMTKFDIAELNAQRRQKAGNAALSAGRSRQIKGYVSATIVLHAEGTVETILAGKNGEARIVSGGGVSRRCPALS